MFHIAWFYVWQNYVIHNFVKCCARVDSQKFARTNHQCFWVALSERVWDNHHFWESQSKLLDNLGVKNSFILRQNKKSSCESQSEFWWIKNIVVDFYNVVVLFEKQIGFVLIKCVCLLKVKIGAVTPLLLCVS